MTSPNLFVPDAWVEEESARRDQETQHPNLERILGAIGHAASVLARRHSSHLASTPLENTNTSLGPLDVPLNPYPASWGSSRRT